VRGGRGGQGGQGGGRGGRGWGLGGGRLGSIGAQDDSPRRECSQPTLGDGEPHLLSSGLYACGPPTRLAQELCKLPSTALDALVHLLAMLLAAPGGILLLLDLELSNQGWHHLCSRSGRAHRALECPAPVILPRSELRRGCLGRAGQHGAENARTSVSPVSTSTATSFVLAIWLAFLAAFRRLFAMTCSIVKRCSLCTVTANLPPSVPPPKLPVTPLAGMLSSSLLRGCQVLDPRVLLLGLCVGAGADGHGVSSCRLALPPASLGTH